MTAESLIVGIGIVAFLLLYFTQVLDKKEHVLLKMITLFFFVFMLVLIPKASLDFADNCKVVINSTEEHNTTYTEYGYDYFCSTSDYNTPVTFFRSVTWFIRIFVLYIAVYYSWLIFNQFKESIQTGTKLWERKKP